MKPKTFTFNNWCGGTLMFALLFGLKCPRHWGMWHTGQINTWILFLICFFFIFVTENKKNMRSLAIKIRSTCVISTDEMEFLPVLSMSIKCKLYLDAVYFFVTMIFKCKLQISNVIETNFMFNLIFANYFFFLQRFRYIQSKYTRIWCFKFLCFVFYDYRCYYSP